MEPLVLELSHSPDVPLEADTLVPEKLEGLSAAEVARVPLRYGRDEVPVGEFFSVSGERCQGHIHICGDLFRVKYLGYGMTRGKLTVEGPVGMHLGAEMSGGYLEVEGNSDDWAGANMAGGTLLIRGDAGHLVGAAYRGDEKGMRGGLLVVSGSAGNECGYRQRRGTLVVGGDCGDFAGAEMRAGTLAVLGKAGLRPGIDMRRGSLILGEVEGLLPTFFFCCQYRPPFLPLLAKEIDRLNAVKMSEYWKRGSFMRFLGDVNEVGKGEILLWQW